MTASPCARPWSPRRSPGWPARTGATPPSSPTPRSCCTPCPTGKAPRCAGSPKTRSPTCHCIPGFAASWQRLRTAPASLPLDHGDERRQFLPRTIEIEAGVFVWCMPGEAGQEPSQLTRGSARCCQRRTEPLGRGPRVGGRGDRPHHHDPPRTGVAAPRAAAARRCHRSRTTACRFRARRRSAPAPGPAPGGPVWWAWASTGRRRSSRPGRRPRRPPARGHGWTVRAATSGPTMSRATSSGRSPCPRCSTSAPAARAMSARSLTANKAPCRRAASARISHAASSSRASSGPNRCSPADPLSRSWMMSTPPARAASANSARSPRSRRASVHRYSRAAARAESRLSMGRCTPRR